MKRMKLAVAGLCVAWFTLAVAQGQALAAAAVTRAIPMDMGVAGQTVDLAVDSMLELKLPINPSTGYQWMLAGTQQPGAPVRLYSREPGSAPELENARVVMPGMEMTQIVRFVPQAAGTTDVALVYARPWEKKPPTKTLNFKIRSQGAFQGSLPVAKPRALPPIRSTPETIMAPGLPSYFDWYDSGDVTEIKDQGTCGSCWAFGAVAIMESKLLIEDGMYTDLSEQYLVSCNSDGFGCDGGWWAHNYHMNKYVSGEPGAGARDESEFYYEGWDAPCNPPHTAREKIDKWAYVDDVPDGAIPTLDHWPTVAEIKQKIYDYGPVGTVVCSNTWSGYTGGIFYDHCDVDTHIVAITGWDDSQGVFYIKNSWGTSWGEGGYMRLPYDYCLVGYLSTYLYYKDAPPAPPIAEFSGSPTSVAPGGTVTFTDQSTGVPTAWSWSFPGGTPATSTAQNPSVKYNTAGTYNVTLTVSNSLGSNTKTKTSYITVEPQYCTSASTSCYDEWIARVQVGSLNNSSDARVYTNFTNLTANLTTGQTVSVTLTPGFQSGTYTEYWRIWVDWNKDYDFADAGEQVFSSPGSTRAVTGQFTVPATASGKTRMRVSMRFNASPTYCGSFVDGEVEDYSVNVTGGTVLPPVAAFMASATSVSVGQSVAFTDQSTNTPTSWSWTFPGGTPSTSTVKNPAITYNMSGTYSVTLTATNSAGSNTLTKTNYITVGNTPPVNYCAATHRYNYAYITNVKVGSINNTTGWGTNGYADFTALSTSMTAGTGFPITVTAYNQYWTRNSLGIWADWNQDGDWADPGETIYSAIKAGPYSATVTPPTTAKKGTTRMRVRLMYDKTATPCGADTYLGDVEDYSIVVQ